MEKHIHVGPYKLRVGGGALCEGVTLASPRGVGTQYVSFFEAEGEMVSRLDWFMSGIESTKLGAFVSMSCNVG